MRKGSRSTPRWRWSYSSCGGFGTLRAKSANSSPKAEAITSLNAFRNLPRIDGLLEVVFLAALAWLCLWDVGKPAPWYDEGATISNGLSISAQSFFLPNSKAYHDSRATDRRLTPDVWLPSSIPLGPAYLAALAVRVGDPVYSARFTFAAAGFIGIVVFSRAVRRAFPGAALPLLFLGLVLASPYLFPYIRTIRHYSLQVLALSVYFYGLVRTLNPRGRAAYPIMAAGLLLAYLAFWPLFLALASASVVVLWLASRRGDPLQKQGRGRLVGALVVGAALILFFNNVPAAFGGELTGLWIASASGEGAGAGDGLGLTTALNIAGNLLYLTNSHVRLTGAAEVMGVTILGLGYLLLRGRWKEAAQELRRGWRAYAPVIVPAGAAWTTGLVLYSLSRGQLLNIRYSVGLHIWLLATAVLAVGILWPALRAGRERAGYVLGLALIYLVLNSAYLIAGAPGKSRFVQYQGYLEFLTHEYRGPVDYFCDYIQPAAQALGHLTIAASYGPDTVMACLLDLGLFERISSQPDFVIPRPEPDPYPSLDQIAPLIQNAERRYREIYDLDGNYMRVTFPVRDFGFNSNLIGRVGAQGLADCSTDPASCARLYVRKDLYAHLYRQP